MIGIDEVGRGAWAGPLLVVAFRQLSSLPVGVTDSKKITRPQRQALLTEIIRAGNVGEGWVTAQEIDSIGLAEAMRWGVTRALSRLGAVTDEPIIIDGPVNYCPLEFVRVKTAVSGDSLYPHVGAASIIAKELRDQHMIALSAQYPNYGFEKHVGYGTAQHAAALRALGICDIHRLSYKPVRIFWQEQGGVVL